MKFIKLFEAFILEYVDIDFYTLSNDYQELMQNTSRDLLSAIQAQQPIKFKLIPKTQYKNALLEFIRYGRFVRFPDKYIFQWKDLLMENIFKLNGLTEIHGHSQNFPTDDFSDVFDYNQDTDKERDGEYTKWFNNKDYDWENDDPIYSFYSMSEYLEKEFNIDDMTPQFSNGHYVLSDYATEPLMDLAVELDQVESPEEIIVVINKILDVTHQRSDIAEIFIQGGSDTLFDISN